MVYAIFIPLIFILMMLIVFLDPPKANKKHLKSLEEIDKLEKELGIGLPEYSSSEMSRSQKNYILALYADYRERGDIN